MVIPRGLGKGLGALLGESTPQSSAPSSGILMLPLQKIEPNPEQPRGFFDETELRALCDSIAMHGVIQPLAVRKLPSGFYQIIAGERRWRAARMAGLLEVPVVIMDVDDQKATELSLVENLQRQDLNPIEEALGYQRLMAQFHLTQETAAERVGRSRPSVANALRLLSLPAAVQALLLEGKLTAGHARAILMLKSEDQQGVAAQKIVSLALSVRQAEMLCQSMAKTRTPKKPSFTVDYLKECERSLARCLGRSVRIVSGKRKGRVELEFYDPDDLQRLFEALRQMPQRRTSNEK